MKDSKGLNANYIQSHSSLDEIEKFRQENGGISYTEIKGVRIDFYISKNLFFIVSNRNKKYLKITLSDELINSGFKLEKMRLIGNRLYTFIIKHTVDENGRSITAKRSFEIDSIFINKNTNTVEENV